MLSKMPLPARISVMFDFCYLQQHEHPYVSAMIGNGSTHYDHDSDGTHSQVAGCSVSVGASYAAIGTRLKNQSHFEQIDGTLRYFQKLSSDSVSSLDCYF